MLGVVEKPRTWFGDVIETDPAGFEYARSPHGDGVKDWTNPRSEREQPDRWGRGISGVENYWEENWRENKQYIKETFPRGEPFQKGPHHGETCIIVGNGPSLKKNGHLLAGKQHIIGCNRVALLPGVIPEYYVAMDCGKPHGGMHPEWVDGICEKSTAVMSIVTFPPLARKFKRVWWFDHWGGNAKLSQIARRKAKIELGILDTGLFVSFSMLHFAYKMGFKKIIFAGFDYCFTRGFEHFTDTEPSIMLTEDGKGAKVTGHLNEVFHRRGYGPIPVDNPDALIHTDELPCFSMPDHIAALKLIATACWFLVRRGIKIVNCSEAGLFNMPWIQVDKLENHV